VGWGREGWTSVVVMRRLEMKMMKMERWWDGDEKVYDGFAGCKDV
jgi:hypothetical protein